MAPGRRRGAKGVKSKNDLGLGDLVLAKVKGFPAWPAKVHSCSLCCFARRCFLRPLSLDLSWSNYRLPRVFKFSSIGISICLVAIDLVFFTLWSCI